MAIPDYQTLMLPLLRLAADGEVHSARSAHDSLAAQFELTELKSAWTEANFSQEQRRFLEFHRENVFRLAAVRR